MSYIISTKTSKFSNFREMKKWGNCVQFYHLCVYYSLSHVKFFVTPRTVAIQAPLPWNSPGKDTRVGCHSLLGILQTQGWNLVLLHCRRILYNLSHEEALYHLVRAKKKKNMEQPGDLCSTEPILLGWFCYSFYRHQLWAWIKKSFKWTIGALVMSVSMSTCMFIFLIYAEILLSAALNFISHKLIVFISNSSLHNKFRSQVYCFLDMWHWQFI